MPKSKKRAKSKAKRTGRKGRRGVRKSAKKATKRKSSKRSRAARKAAKTRAAKKEARRAAGRKAARSRKNKGGGKKRKSGKRKSSKRSAAARKGARTKKRNESKRSKSAKKGARKARKSGKRRSSRRTSPDRIYRKALAEGNRHDRQAARLRKQYESALKANKNRSAAQVEKLRKQQERLKARLQYHEGMAAEARKSKKGKRRNKSKRDKNPIGSGGMVEYAAVAGGVLTAIAMTIVPYRLIRSHALIPGQGAPPVDQPKQGDVPNLLTGQLPLWSRLKWKGAVALGVVLVGDIAVPLFVASRIKTSDGWKTYFQMWGWTSVALSGTKLVVDVLALATKSTSLGQRLFAPENTARDVRVQSAAAQLPPIAVAPGVGLPGLTGYGTPEAAGCEHVGAGAPCRDSCKQSKHVPRGGATPQQGGNPPQTSVPPVQTNPDGTVTSPLPGPGGTTPPAGTIPRVIVQTRTPGGSVQRPLACDSQARPARTTPA